MKKSIFPGLLVGLTTLVAGCDGAESGDGSGKTVVEPSITGALNGATTNVPPMKGVVELLSNDGTRCSGVMINNFAILTSARCLRPYLNGSTSMDDVSVFHISTTGFHQRARIWTKHCIDSPLSGDELRCDQGTGTAKAIRYYVQSPTETAGDASNDLGMVVAKDYLWHDAQDFADIYMNATLPSGETSLQVYGYGMTAAFGDAGIYRTGSMRVSSMGSKVVKLYPDASSAQTCWGDEGAPFAIRPSVSGSANEVVAIEVFRSAIDYTTACSERNGTVVSDHATRVADKIAWIESIIGPCASMNDAAGRPIKRCWQMQSCAAQPPTAEYAWNGCYGSGCSACETLLGAYPNYYRNHPNCSRNTACSGKTPVGCSTNCPKPGPGDL